MGISTFSCSCRVTIQVVVIMASSFSAALPLRDSCTNRRVPEMSTMVRMITTVRGSKSSGTLPSREKYGNTNGKYQEKEGILLAEEFLKDTDLPEEIKKRVVFLVGHHHTLTGIDGIDYQILLEADYLVNADECGYSEGNISNTKRKLFKTKTGLRLLEAVYGI